MVRLFLLLTTLWVAVFHYNLMGTELLVCNQSSYQSFHHRVYEKCYPKLKWLEEEFPFEAVKESTQVIYIADKNEWHDIFSNSPLSDWGVGVAVPDQNRIYLLVGNHTLEEISRVLVHESVHILLHRLFHERDIPRWFDEGVAQFFSGERMEFQKLVALSNLIMANRIPLLQSVDSVNDYSGNKAAIAYILSLDAVNFLQTHYENKSVNGFLSSIASDNKDFEKLFHDYFNYSTAAFESDYIEHMKKNYKFFFIFNFENIALLIIVFLFIGSYFHIRARNRRIMESWPDNDNQETLEEEI